MPGPRSRGLSSSTFGALRNSDFRLLYFGNILQFGAMQMQQLVRGVLVFQLTGSFAALGVVALANAIPGLALSLLGGVVADRAPKKTVIQTAQLFNMANAAVLAVLAGMGLLSFNQLLISAVLQGGVNAVMMPSRQSIILDLVGRERLMNAVALNTSGQNLMQLIGPGIGGALLAFLSPAAVFWVMAGLYLGAVTFTVRLPKKPIYSFAEQNLRAGVVRKPTGGLRDMIEGVRYVAQDPTIRMLICVNFLIVVVSLPYTMMLPGFVHDVLHKGPGEQGLMLSISGVGAVIGSLAVASMSDTGYGRLLLVYATMLGIALVAFSASTHYFITLPIMLVIGAGTAGRMSLGQVLIQKYSADEYRGRVMAVWFMQFSLVSLGTFAVGILSELIGPQIAIGGMAAGMVVAMLLVTVFVPRFREL